MITLTCIRPKTTPIRSSSPESGSQLGQDASMGIHTLVQSEECAPLNFTLSMTVAGVIGDSQQTTRRGQSCR
jgi:hypothetical protein